MIDPVVAGQAVQELDTPDVLVDLDIVAANIRYAQAIADSVGAELWPHIKTSKSPVIAALQRSAGARGLTVAKLGEAEVFHEHGLGPLLVAYPLLGSEKLRRLRTLIESGARVAIALDSVAVATPIARLATELAVRIPIWLEVDTGNHRLGVDPDQAPALYGALSRLGGLQLEGLMSYAGQVHTGSDLDAKARIVRAEVGLLRRLAGEIQQSAPNRPVGIHVGGTLHLMFPEELKGVTALRPGTYVYNDRMVVAGGAARLDDCAAQVLCTVVSRPAPDRAIVDAGTKTLAADPIQRPGLTGYGTVLDHPELEIYRLQEEHGFIKVPDPARGPQIGDRLRIVPNHVCSMMNLHERVVGVRTGRVERLLPVAARGRIR